MIMRVSIFLSLFFMMCFPSYSATLIDIRAENGTQKSTFHFHFSGKQNYHIFQLKKPERIVIDFAKSTHKVLLPKQFSDDFLIKRVRISKPKDPESLRIVLELTQPVKIQSQSNQEKTQFSLIIIPENAKKETISSFPTSGKVTVVIDAGHGGQDPGAIGRSGLQEKKVTLSIARKLAEQLNSDPLFKAVLTRDKDYFLSVMGRSDVAREYKANVLISIHADAAPNRTARGASVWVLSNRRANSEMANWLEQHEKQSELLGGAGDLLANRNQDPYLSQAVLDLQFGHSQRVAYDISTQILKTLQNVTLLHKSSPEHASLGVLRSPDIPSLLIETGFISNIKEEKLLNGEDYQQKMATAIHQGLRTYYLAHPLQTRPKSAVTAEISQNPVISEMNAEEHRVKSGETLSGIAARHGVTLSSLMKLNELRKENLQMGQRLKIPDAPVSIKTNPALMRVHHVVPGDTLIRIARQYHVTMQVIMQVNNMTSTEIKLGQTLKIPLS